MPCRSMVTACWQLLTVVEMDERDDRFDSPNVVFNRIASDRERGLSPDLRDIDWHLEDCRTNRFPEPRRQGAPSKYHEHLNIAKMVVRWPGNRDKSIEKIAEKVSKDFKTIEGIYDRHRAHAESMVRMESMVSAVARLAETVGVDDAAWEVAREVDLPEHEVRFHYEHWKLNFPNQLRRLARAAY